METQEDNCKTVEDFRGELNTKATERMEETIPDGLILKIKTNQSIKEVSVYDLIAYYIGLNFINQDIYVNESGEEFIRTRYGFQPAVRYNQNIKIIAQEKLIDELQYKLKFTKEKADRYAEMIKLFEAKSRLQKTKTKKLAIPFVDENEALRQENKLLKQTLHEFKQVNESILTKLTRLLNQTNEMNTSEQSSNSDLDWSTFDDVLNYNNY